MLKHIATRPASSDLAFFQCLDRPLPPISNYLPGKIDLPTSVDAQLKAAMQRHLQGDTDAAEALYRDVLASTPRNALAEHYLGYLLLQSERLPEALPHLQQAVTLEDGHSEWHFNLGIALARMQRHEAAIEAFCDAIALDNCRYFYWTNLGSAYETQQAWQRAEQCYLAASHIDGSCPDAYFLLSALYLTLARYDEARHFHHLAIVATPAASQSRILRGQAFYELGRPEEARAVFAEWLAAEPDNPVAQHLLTAYSGQAVPAQCASSYVEQTFDEFARSFDVTLGRLQYRGPQLVENYLAEQVRQEKLAAMLDLGCGTGLIGAAAQEYVQCIVGVDISQPMLDQAQAKQCYQHLYKSDIVAFLQQTERHYALITCMDTLNYLGRLDAIFALIAARLSIGGSLLFTTEKLTSATSPYRLNTSGRYSHRPEYIADILERCDLRIATIQEVTLRFEAGTPIIGEFICARRAA